MCFPPGFAASPLFPPHSKEPKALIVSSLLVETERQLETRLHTVLKQTLSLISNHTVNIFIRFWIFIIVSVYSLQWTFSHFVFIVLFTFTIIVSHFFYALHLLQYFLLCCLFLFYIAYVERQTGHNLWKRHFNFPKEKPCNSQPFFREMNTNEKYRIQPDE